MAGGELGLAAQRRVLGLALAGGLRTGRSGARSSRSARSRVIAASTSRVERSGAIGSNVTATVRTALERPSSASMNIGETSTRGQPPIQYVAWTAPSLR